MTKRLLQSQRIYSPEYLFQLYIQSDLPDIFQKSKKGIAKFRKKIFLNTKWKMKTLPMII